MITIEHRKADILNQMFNQNLTALINNLAQLAEENEALKAKVTELEKEKQAAAADALPDAPI